MGLWRLVKLGKKKQKKNVPPKTPGKQKEKVGASKTTAPPTQKPAPVAQPPKKDELSVRVGVLRGTLLEPKTVDLKYDVLMETVVSAQLPVGRVNKLLKSLAENKTVTEKQKKMFQTLATKYTSWVTVMSKGATGKWWPPVA